MGEPWVSSRQWTVTNAGVFPVQISSSISISNGAILSISPGAIVSVSNLATTFYTIPISIWSTACNFVVAQTDTVLQTAPGASLCIYVTDLMISNGGVSGTMFFEEDTASTKKLKIPILYLESNTGLCKKFAIPIKCTANKDFGVTTKSCTTHTILVNGYVGA